MPFIPAWPGQPCSLGFLVLEWMEEYLTAPDRNDGSPFIPTLEQAEFIIRFYEVDRATGSRRTRRRGVLSRPKGWGKSPILGAIAAAEALCEVVPDGFDADGQPVGIPWWTQRTTWVQLAAVSEDQTQNSWTPLQEMVGNDHIIDTYRGLDPMESFIALPKGRIERVTASAASREGNRPVFAVLDQTESWTRTNGGVRLAATIRRNLAKTGGTSIESPNAFIPGEGSVAEASAEYFKRIQEKKARDDGLLYDHREGAVKNLADKKELTAGLRTAYGCSSNMKCVLPGHKHDRGWVDLKRLVAEVYDPDTDPQDARRYYLNQVTNASDSYISHPEWSGCLKEDAAVRDGDLITLGFDGSRGRAEGKPDATALIGCRIEDGYVFELGVWEADEGPGMESWQPPLPAIDAAVADAFRRYKVAAFYCDPAKDWRSKVNEWEAKYAKRLAKNKAGKQVLVNRDHPFEWWMTGGRSVFIERAVKAFSGAVRNGELVHSGTAALTRHVLNARRRVSHQHLTVGKENSSSPHKVDACIAAILAWQGRMDAVAAGVSANSGTKAVKRLR